MIDMDYGISLEKWSLGRKEKKKGISPVKSCPNCEAITFLFLLRIYEYCEHEFPALVKEDLKGFWLR